MVNGHLLHLTPPGAQPSPAPVDTSTLPASVLRVGHAGAVLFSPWVPTVVSVLALTACVLTGRRLVRRRRSARAATGTSTQSAARRYRGRAVSASGALASVVLVALAVGAGVNAYAGYLPTPRSAARFLLGREGAGSDTVQASGVDVARALGHTVGGAAALAHGDTHWKLQTLHLSDPGLDIASRTVLVATPPGYVSGRGRYPVVYLFSGYPGRAVDWFVSGRITQTVDALAATGRFPYVIAVAPDVNGGFFSDSETLDAVHGPQVETWVTRDVVSMVDSRYRTEADRSGRIIAGMSSGGFAALNLALHHQDEFGQALALEPYGDPGNVTQRLLGGSVALLHANSPSYYAPDIPLHRTLPIFLDVGSGGDVGPVTALGAVLRARGEPVLTRVERGQRHTWSEVSAGLPYALTFAAQHLGDPAALDAVLASSRFPVVGKDHYANTLSPDAQAVLHRQLVCDLSIRAAGDTTVAIAPGCAHFDRFCTRATLRRLPAQPTGSQLVRACPPVTRPPARTGRRHTGGPSPAPEKAASVRYTGGPAETRQEYR